MSGDGPLGDFIRSFMKTPDERDQEMVDYMRVYGPLAKAGQAETKLPKRLPVNKWGPAYTWAYHQGRKPTYFISSVGVGTVAAAKNDVDSYIFWTEQELLKSQGKPYATGKRN